MPSRQILHKSEEGLNITGQVKLIDHHQDIKGDEIGGKTTLIIKVSLSGD